MMAFIEVSAPPTPAATFFVLLPDLSSSDAIVLLFKCPASESRFVRSGFSLKLLKPPALRKFFLPVVTAAALLPPSLGLFFGGIAQPESIYTCCVFLFLGLRGGEPSERHTDSSSSEISSMMSLVMMPPTLPVSSPLRVLRTAELPGFLELLFSPSL